MTLQLLCANLGSFDDAMTVVRHCRKLMDFDAVTIMHPEPRPVDGVETMKLTGKDMTKVWMREVPAAVRCDRVLSVHWDGFIQNNAAWRDAWLEYDWIGAPWRLENIPNPLWRVGSGGFCLFSRRMAEAWPKICTGSCNHDWEVGALRRGEFEALGMRFAPLAVAADFAKECDLEDLAVPEGVSFGFHGFQYAPTRKMLRRQVYGPTIHIGKFSDYNDAFVRQVRHRKSVGHIDAATIKEVDQADIILPLGADEATFLARLRHPRALAPGAEAVALVEDKIAFSRWLERHYPENSPSTFAVKVGTAVRQLQPFEYPAIYKRAKVCSSVGSYLLRVPDDLEWENEDGMVQEYIVGDRNHTVQVFCLDGEIKRHIHLVEETDPMQIKVGAMGGEYTIGRLKPKHLDLVADIFRRLDWHGFACIDMKIVDDVPFIIEINPRPGGTLLRNVAEFEKMLDAVCAEIS